MELTWLDSNSWLIVIGGKRILVDPWLVGPLMFGDAAWFFKAERRIPREIPQNIDLILLSQGLPDHTHPATLQALSRQIPVIGSPSAAQIVKSLGYTDVTALDHGATATLGNLYLEAVPGSPTGPKTLENGYILKDLQLGHSLYYEPHGYHSPVLQTKQPIDVVITPTVNLTLPLLGAVIKGQESAINVAQWLQPQYLINTAAGGDLVASGFLLKFLKLQGTTEALQANLAAQKLTTQVLELTPWQQYSISLGSKNLSDTSKAIKTAIN
ncbi:MAG: MBL fold metallo-hydrolase [Pseudanabaena sp. ELA607]|jgi:L-ascorbate metabolism protein UlaG (beta-lactamase superfamily)